VGEKQHPKVGTCVDLHTEVAHVCHNRSMRLMSLDGVCWGNVRSISFISLCS
jgi:hypothetical protein